MAEPSVPKLRNHGWILTVSGFILITASLLLFTAGPSSGTEGIMNAVLAVGSAMLLGVAMFSFGVSKIFKAMRIEENQASGL